MWSAASLPATGWRTAICCCARARRTTPCSAAEGNDVHRPLRAGTGGETHRAAHLARHPVPGAEPGGPAVARVPAPRVGAGPRHRRGESLLTLTFDAYPLSHSLLTLIGWGVVLAVLYRWRSGDARAATVVALLVVSHWVLDFVTHVPDMPLYPGGPTVGLGLWNSVAGTVIIEGSMFVAGAWIYVTTTRARDAVGRYALWALLAFLLVSYVASLFTGPPPTLQAIEFGGIV